MEGAEENRENVNISWPMNGVTGDSVHRFVNQNHFQSENEQSVAEEDEEIELSLGLSMNGRFGVDPARKKLRRSSSVSNLACPVGSVDNESSRRVRGAASETHASLGRTCSLPEGRRRPVRCMQARRNRMEKLKNVRDYKESSSSENGGGLQLHASDDVNGSGNVQRLDSGIINGFQNCNLMNSHRVSIGSTRSCSSSGASDPHSQLMEGARQNPAVGAAKTGANKEDELMKDALMDMPYVSTRGHGPNCDKIEGFLYRYKKGEEVKIVCVCHGLFLTPAEFVKHGGGGDVAQPLKHIVVNPFPLF